ncbi:helix-turn-helix transcriptional regulator [Pararhodobacter aggregans]
MAQRIKATPETERGAYASVADLAAHFSVSVDTIWRWARVGDFPAPVKLSPQLTRWRWADVTAWEAARAAA